MSAQYTSDMIKFDPPKNKTMKFCIFKAYFWKECDAKTTGGGGV